MLDAGNVLEWTDLPGYVVDKWRRGLIRPAHFADICRIDLLYRHGGFWMDATDFIVAELPEWIAAQDFFVYMSGEAVKGWYSYIQNCFIRGRKGNYLLKAWREAVLAYWKHENSVVDYFVHQLLFRKVTECNPLAGELFAKMRRSCRTPPMPYGSVMLPNLSTKSCSESDGCGGIPEDRIQSSSQGPVAGQFCRCDSEDVSLSNALQVSRKYLLPEDGAP